MQVKELADKIRNSLGKVIFGQEQVIELLLVGLLSQGHILLEGIPGTAKTMLVKYIAHLIQLDFKRVQLTPDLLPSEIIGTSVYDLNTREFSFKKGPVFTDLLLADEINRTPPKTQSALLEAMEERQVTIEGNQEPLSELFTVIATLNPVEFEGTYPLPEAQLDRFMMKINVTYPAPEAEKEMLMYASGRNEAFYVLDKSIEPVATIDDIKDCRRQVSEVKVDESVVDYILSIIQDTRNNVDLELGCSPRSALALMAASRAYAAINGQDFVTPDHVKFVAPAILRHRVLLTASAELDELSSDDIIKQTLNRITVPR